MSNIDKKGTAAASNPAKPQVSKGINSPNSIKGGTAATNYSISPQANVPMGGIDQKKAEIRKGGAYKVNTNAGTGGATNDKAN